MAVGGDAARMLQSTLALALAVHPNRPGHSGEWPLPEGWVIEVNSRKLSESIDATCKAEAIEVNAPYLDWRSGMKV
jgi:hypothetical protein